MVKNNRDGNENDVLKRWYVGILLVVFGGIVLHAPLSVGLSTLWPDYALLIKSWKEILMLVAGLILLVILYQKKRFDMMRDPIIIAIGIYALLHLGLLFLINNGLLASLAGLMIDLRYLLYFCLVYFAMRIYPDKRKMFIKVGLIGALIVLIFAVLQVFVLPYDVLKYIGYNKNTIIPYLVVDRNYSYIRINSTLRGPNPLGAYSVIILSLLVSAVINNRHKKNKLNICITAILSAGGLVALWCSYSRSALFGAIISSVLIVAIFYRASKKVRVAIAAVLVVMLCGITMIGNTQFASNVLLHKNPNGPKVISSNEAHVVSLKSGSVQLATQPLGEGIGSTGSASLFGKSSEVIENQFLFVAHEAGWIGFILFLSIFAAVMIKLWDRRGDWLALGVFTSGIAMALIGLLLPVWVDDTVSIVWWGLAALAIYGQPEKK